MSYTERSSSLFSTNLIFKRFSEWGKIWKCNLGFSKIPVSHLFYYKLGKTWKYSYRPQGQHFKIQILNLWVNLENSFPNLSFTFEKKIGNWHKKRWSHFKCNINDWDISFPKVLGIKQWIRKIIFHWGKWNAPIGKSALTTKYLTKRPWRCLFLS